VSATPPRLPQVSLTLPPELIELVAQRAAEILAERSESAASPWLSLEGAAEYLGWPKQRLYKLTASNAIPHRKHGNRVLFHRAELDQWLDQSRRGPGMLSPATGAITAATSLAQRPPAAYAGSETQTPRRRANAPGPAPKG
jgi:excisionase family DNA binding protein